MSQICWLYTGASELEAYENCSTQLQIVNDLVKAKQPTKIWSTVKPMYNQPEIDGITYYFYFNRPPASFRGDATFDLEMEKDDEWDVEPEPDYPDPEEPEYP